MTTDHAPSRARRCRHPSFASTQVRRTPALVMRCARRPSSSFLATARGLASIRELPPSDIGDAEASWALSGTAARPGAPGSDHRSGPEPRAPLPPTQFRAYAGPPNTNAGNALRQSSVFLLPATVRGLNSVRELPPSDPAGPPNTNAGNALRPSTTFLLLSPLASVQEPPPSDFRAAEAE